jgi:hypothetical protein
MQVGSSGLHCGGFCGPSSGPFENDANEQVPISMAVASTSLIIRFMKLLLCVIRTEEACAASAARIQLGPRMFGVRKA